MKTLGLVMLIAIVAVSCSSQESQPPATAVVVLETTAGNITLELAGDKAPITVKNFLQYVDGGHYDGTIFHRIIANFMIQGGGMTADLRQKTTKPAIKNEGGNGLRNKRGSIAMAMSVAWPPSDPPVMPIRSEVKPSRQGIMSMRVTTSMAVPKKTPYMSAACVRLQSPFTRPSTRRRPWLR